MTTNRHSGNRERIAPVDPYRLGCFGGRVDFLFLLQGIEDASLRSMDVSPRYACSVNC